MTRNELGAWGEELAAAHLKKHGWVILARNWRTRGGELDIVGFDPRRNVIAAVEVKTRRTAKSGSPAESVTPAKVRRLRGLLLQWLLAHGGHATRITIDVVSVDVAGADYTLSHVMDVAQ